LAVPFLRARSTGLSNLHITYAGRNLPQRQAIDRHDYGKKLIEIAEPFLVSVSVRKRMIVQATAGKK
jgi:hypothetical protein